LRAAVSDIPPGNARLWRRALTGIEMKRRVSLEDIFDFRELIPGFSFNLMIRK